ncbi:FHA domain-containing protein [Pedobacter sp.]|uniref:FHA domain-containing protein n=1 Tax=Pedobacter sp. TaxID=1411316 RepID=UPI003D7FB14B
MFNFFKSSKEDQPLDVKVVREHILQFIKEELQKSEGGEGANIHTLILYAAPVPNDKHLYEAACYVSEPERLKQEVQRIADNFAVNLPKDWQLEFHVVENLLNCGIKYDSLPLELCIETTPVALPEVHVVKTDAILTVISGQAEESSYTLTSKDGRTNMGREKNTTTSGGSIRVNKIAFPEDAEFVGNRFVSRQHAHLEWDDKKGGFVLFADEGGVPPGNKTKVQSLGDEGQVKLNSTQVGHFLKDEDQIILGESVVLQFNYKG